MHLWKREDTKPSLVPNIIRAYRSVKFQQLVGQNSSAVLADNSAMFRASLAYRRRIQSQDI
jgi:hypothetical protein